jgi:hypothetical protein
VVTFAALLAIGSWAFFDFGGLRERLAGPVWLFTSMLTVWAIPAAIGIAILRHHLYDIDRLINRTLVFGLLTATPRPRLRRRDAGARAAVRRDH